MSDNIQATTTGQIPPCLQQYTCQLISALEDSSGACCFKLPAGTYPVKICVVPSEKYGDRYACVKVAVSSQKPFRYELGMMGDENLDEELGEDVFFGFGVDAGMGCIADIGAREAFQRYWEQPGLNGGRFIHHEP